MKITRKLKLTLGSSNSSPRCSAHVNYIKFNKSIRIAGTIASIVLLAVLSLLSFPIVIKSEVAEGTSGVVEVPTLTMVVGQESANLDLVVRSSNGTFATTNSTSSIAFTVKTNNYTGYTLSVSADDNNQVLTNSNTGNTLKSITSAVSETDFSNVAKTETLNKWGYLPSTYYDSSSETTITNTDTYFPAPTNKTPTILDKTNTANTTANNYTIGLGAKVDYTVPSGLYTNTYTLTAVANPVAYHIYYYDGIDNDKAIGNQQSETNTSATITLSPTYTSGSAPTRSTYTFKSWCLGTVNTTTIANTNASGKVTSYSNPATVCTGTEYTTGSNMPIDPTVDNTDIKLYAVWSPTTFDTAYQQVAASTGDSTITNKVSNSYQMQKMNKDICAKVTPNQYTTLADSRDNTTYVVGKLEDNRCWMVDNLDLDLTSATIIDTLNTSNTHIDSASLTSLKSGNRSVDARYATAGLSKSNWSSGDSYVIPQANRSGKCNPDMNSGAPCTSPYQGANYTHDTVIAVNNIGPGKYKVGTNYNYCAASGGNYCYDPSSSHPSVDASYDICSYGWKMPATSEHRTLYSTLRANYPTTVSDSSSPYSFQAMLSTTFSGTFDGGTAWVQGSGFYPWSTTYQSDNYMQRLNANRTTVYVNNYHHRASGSPVRCLAQN